MKNQVRLHCNTIGTFAAACLSENEVDTVFGIPGTHNIELYRGIQYQGMRHVLTRHEQGAAYAADGYARATGRPGVVVATSGPGVTNCITGIANAYADSIPLLVISPGAPRGYERRDLGFLHEAKDQRSGIQHFADASVRVESQEALQEAIHQTFLKFRTGRPRPVHIEIPTDLIEEPAEGIPDPGWSAPLLVPDAASIIAVTEAILKAKKPLIVIGGGAAASGKALTALADHTGIPVVTTVAGKGTVSERHPGSVGALAGGSEGFAPLEMADLILAFGTEFKGANPHEEATVVRFDIDISQLNKHHRADIPVVGDVGQSAAALLETIKGRGFQTSKDWIAEVLRAADASRSDAQHTWRELHSIVLEAAGDSNESPVILTGDSSQISWIGTVKSAVLERSRSFLTTDGYATLGYGLPAAIGAKIARAEAKVISLLGDGALMFSVQELATAAEQRLGIPIVVLDNGGYAEIKQNMQDAGVVPFGVEFTSPNYEALAAAMHCGFLRAATPDELCAALGQALQVDYPTLILIEESDFKAPAWRGRFATYED